MALWMLRSSLSCRRSVKEVRSVCGIGLLIRSSCSPDLSRFDVQTAGVNDTPGVMKQCMRIGDIHRPTSVHSDAALTLAIMPALNTKCGRGVRQVSGGIERSEVMLVFPRQLFGVVDELSAM